MRSAILLSTASVLVLGLAGARQAAAEIKGLTGPNFTLSVNETDISTADGSSVYMWGCAPGAGGQVQYPCPTLIVNQGDLVTVTLNNAFPAGGQRPDTVSLIFPGQSGVTADGGVVGPLAKEAERGNPVTYSFTAAAPGTYLYESSTDLGVEMGIVGALIVRPSGFDPSAPRAYGHSDTAYDYEYLFLETDIDSDIHDVMALGHKPDMSKRFATYYMLNGRTGLDTLLTADLPWLPSQPYNALARAQPMKKVLMRVIDAGLDLHPFHHHGNHAAQIAHDGRLLTSAPNLPGVGPDLAELDFTIQTTPGETYDAIWEWTGEGLGWDVYGHTDPNDGKCKPSEQICPNDPLGRVSDYGKPFPVLMPDAFQIAYGPYWSGSQFLGTIGNLPPGNGGLNIHGGMYYMWHSHTEKELTNYDVYPGGMLTMMIVEPPSVTDIK